MTIPTELIGSLPRPAELLAALGDHAAGRIDDAALAVAQSAASVTRSTASSRPDRRS